MSIKEIIIKHLESEYGDKWCYAGKIEDHIRNLLGSKASNASRRCRELERSGILEKQLVQVEGTGPKVVQYRVAKVEVPIIGTVENEEVSYYDTKQNPLL